MSKSILIIDTPECCDMCKLGFNDEYCDEFECFLEPTRRLANPEGEKPDWCPLNEVPHEVDENETYTDAEYYRAQGYNACIDEILKESD